MASVLEMRQITKRYGDLLANNNVDFRLERGEVHAIVGENGAGKSTLMKILYGLESPTSGEIRVNGQPVHFKSPTDAIRHGIGMVHQHFMLFPPYTIAQNVVAGREPSKAGFLSHSRARQVVAELARTYHMDVDVDQKISRCPVGIQQRAEILKVLYQGAQVVVLDEPTAVLTPMESLELIRAIRGLAAQGKSVILITHKLNEVMAAADTVTVLRNGRVTGEAVTRDTTIEELSRLMVGRDIVTVQPGNPPRDEIVLEVQGVTIGRHQSKPALNDINFMVHSGEIVGIAGVSGNGQSELIRAVTGLEPIDSGAISVLGKSIANQTVQFVRTAGVAHIPEDRQEVGSAPNASVQDNMVIGHHRSQRFQKRGFLQQRTIRNTVADWISRFLVKTQSERDRIGSLSGGNVQKAIFAREMEHHTPLLVAAEPTRGVDISAVEFIHGQLMARRRDGAAILLVSSDLTEIMALSDRILVIFEGQIVGELNRGEATEETISLWMAGGRKR